MNKTVEIWEQSGLLDGLDETERMKCANKMEAMKRFLSSPAYTSLNTEGLFAEPIMVMFPIVRKMFVKEQEYDVLNLVKEFVVFCRENQTKSKYEEAEDPELELTFDFCDEYIE